MTEFNEVFKNGACKSEHRQIMDELEQIKRRIKDLQTYPPPYIPYPVVPYKCCPYVNPCLRGKWVPCRLDCWECPYAPKINYWEYEPFYNWNLHDSYNTAVMPMSMPIPEGLVFIPDEVT